MEQFFGFINGQSLPIVSFIFCIIVLCIIFISAASSRGKRQDDK